MTMWPVTLAHSTINTNSSAAQLSRNDIIAARRDIALTAQIAAVRDMLDQ